MAMSEKSISAFTQELASKAAVPGGGGAAALAGALGIALGNMVGSLTVGKKKYAAVESEVWELKAKADVLQQKLLAAIDADVEAFEPLSKAYGLPAVTEEEIAKKNEVLEKALATAAEAPIEMMQLAMDSLLVIQRMAEIGSRLAVSDAGCGAALCKAAMQCASLNVYINTKMMKNRETAEQLNDRTDRLLSEGAAVADKIFESVKSNLC